MRPLLPLLLLALLLRAPNRIRSAWWILLALAISLLFSWGVERSGVTWLVAFVHDSFTVFVFALAFLWLLADKLAQLTRLRALFNAAGMLAITGGVGLFSLNSLDVNPALTYGVFATVALANMALAGVACREHYSPKRFLLWHCILTVVGAGILAFLVAGLVAFLPSLLAGNSIRGGDVHFHVFNTMLPAGVGGAALFVGMLPFLVLVFRNSLYRQRFHAIFRLPGMNYEHHGAYTTDKAEEYKP